MRRLAILLIVLGLAVPVVLCARAMTVEVSAASGTGRIDLVAVSRGVGESMRWTSVGLCVAGAGVVLWILSRRNYVRPSLR